jgi:hypothetical protein
VATRRSDIRSRRRANPREEQFAAIVERQGGVPRWLAHLYEASVLLAKQYRDSLVNLLAAHSGLELGTTQEIRVGSPVAMALTGLVLSNMRLGVENDMPRSDRVDRFDINAIGLEPILSNAVWSQALVGQSEHWKLETLGALGGALEMLVDQEAEQELLMLTQEGMSLTDARIETLRALAHNLPSEPSDYTKGPPEFGTPDEDELGLVADFHGDLGGAGGRVTSETRESFSDRDLGPSLQEETLGDIDDLEAAMYGGR